MWPFLCHVGITVTAQTVPYFVPDSLEQAVHRLKNAESNIDSINALSVIQSYAARDNAYALNVLGSYHVQGNGEGVSLGMIELEQSGQLGFSPAWHNLGLIYKYGSHGIAQDFVKMYECFHHGTKNQLFEYGTSFYDVGYAKFKGLGCKQDYAEAFELFKRGAVLGNRASSYMVGICYRNGYGVERNEEEALSWLENAAMNGYEDAWKELEELEPECSVTIPLQIEGESIDIPEEFCYVTPMEPLESITGSYTGVIVTYDWSGEHIVRQNLLHLDITEQDGNVEVLWCENGDSTQLTGIYADGIIHFDANYGLHPNHYAPNGNWGFYQDAAMKCEGDYIIANVRLFSVTEMEPERPMYLAVKKDVMGEQEEYTSIAHAVAYPNPFQDVLHINFELLEPQDVRIGIYNTSGNVEYYTHLGNLNTGGHSYVVLPSVGRGCYLLNIYAGAYTYQTIIIRK